MVYILLNVNSRALHDVVYVSETNAEAKQAELGVGWSIVERELEEAPEKAPEAPPTVTE